LEEWVVKPDAIHFRRWEDGREIGRTALGKDFQENFKVPYYVVHRAHFHNALHQRALQLGVVVELNAKVVKYCEKSASVELASNRIIMADLVIAADGKFGYSVYG
jgi:salicylate hydroxylase